MVGSLGGLLPMQFSITFAAILEDGNIITWGLVTGGGDSSAVEAQLRRM